jgi:hypothetical protein
MASSNFLYFAAYLASQMSNRLPPFYYQKYNMTNTDYVEYFKALVGVVET